MAGGKATPRQKMINMMYLVLTALLALNVSSSLLNSFQIIADSLKASADKLGKKNYELGKQIDAAVDEEMKTGQNKNVYLKDLVKEIEVQTNSYVSYLDAIVLDLYSPMIAGRDEETQKMKAPDEQDKNYAYFMKGCATCADTDNDGRGSGKAMKMRDSLDMFIAWANKTYVKMSDENEKKVLEENKKKNGYEQFQKIAIDPKDDPNVPEKDEFKEKKMSWEYMTFHSSPTIANVAILQKLKNDLRVVEAAMLEKVKAKLKDLPPIVMDELQAIYVPEAKVVPVGLPFEATIFLAATSSQSKPQFTGPGIKVKPDGKSATIKITASGAVVDKKTLKGKQTFSANIKVAKTTGGFQDYPIKGSFDVVSPTLDFSSPSNDVLYAECQNNFFVKCPALGDYFAPEFIGTGGSTIPSPSDKSAVSLIPAGNAKKFVLSVKTKLNGQLYDIPPAKEFKVIPPPLPKVLIFENSALWDGSTPIKSGSTITIKIQADKDFEKSLPKDARYKFGVVKFQKVIGSGAFTETVDLQTIPGSKVDGNIVFKVSNFFEKPKPSERLFVDIVEVERVNFQNKESKVPFFPQDLRKQISIK